MSRPSRFSAEQRARAVRLVREAAPGYPSEWAAMESVAAKIGASAETVCKWVRQVEGDGGQRAGLVLGQPFWRDRKLGVTGSTNGVIERFFGTAKYEHLNREDIADGIALAAELARFRTIYNAIRPHQYLDERTPASVHLADDGACP